jgi:hypothetical protein
MRVVCTVYQIHNTPVQNATTQIQRAAWSLAYVLCKVDPVTAKRTYVSRLTDPLQVFHTGSAYNGLRPQFSLV